MDIGLDHAPRKAERASEDRRTNGSPQLQRPTSGVLMPSTQPTQLPSRLLDIPGLADHLGVNIRHVRRLVAERRIPFIKWGHLIRFDPAEIAAWIERARVPDQDTRRGY